MVDNWTLYGTVKQADDINKYRPRSTEDIFQNKYNIESLKKWIKDKMLRRKTEYDYVYLVGKSGTGKSEFVRTCFGDLGYNIIEYDQNINKAELEILKESIVFTSIEQMFGNGQNKKGIVIDNIIDNLSIEQLNTLLKLLKKESKISSPTIFISNNLSKTGNLLKGNVLFIDFEEPQKEDILNLGKKICKKEKIKISQDGLEHFVNNCIILDEKNTQKNYNIRNFLSTLTMLGKSESKLNLKNIEDNQNTMAKDLELNINTTLHHFVNPKYPNNFDIIRKTSMYTSALIHENYLNLINKNISLEELSDIADYIAVGDIYKKKILTTQTWDELGEYIGIFGTYIPGTIIKKNYKYCKNLKINGNFSEIKMERTFRLQPEDIIYSISHILFKLEPTAKWIKEMKKSSRIFRDFMRSNYVREIGRAVKYIDMAYKFSKEKKNNPNIIKKIKTKFRSEWKLLEN